MRKGYYIIGLAIFLLFSIDVIGKANSVHVSDMVTDTLEYKANVNVIIKLKEPEVKTGLSVEDASQTKKNAIAKSQENIISKFKGEKDFKVKYRYTLVNSIAASITSKELEKLKNDPNVEGIYYDIPVHAFLDESVPLIGTNDFWGVEIGDFLVNGTGETICIIDTGIDYTHPALGGCNPGKYETEGNIDEFDLESPHDYPNSTILTFKVNQTGYTQIAVYFTNITTESDYDFVYIVDSDNSSVIATYSGNHQNIWSPYIQGDTLYVWLVSDESISEYGFVINATLNGTVNSSVDWSSCDKVIGGWDVVNSDGLPMDDQGHGTHVSGIAASSDETYKGVAPGARLAAVKSLNNAGDGTFFQVDAGLEWCIGNAERLNISVISISLGDGNYSGPCDSSFPVTSLLVKEAISKNIIVIAASGNNGQKLNISAPACLENVTSVGNSNKQDVIQSDSQSASILDLIAPGTSIRSTQLGGGFVLNSGTSMAAPHVAGAAALIMNFKRLENGSVPSPLQIRDILKATGDNLTDPGNSLDFPRINLTKALAYIDDVPRISFVQIVGNNSLINRNHTFINITVSEPIVNATIELNSVNYTMEGLGRHFHYNITELDQGSQNFTIFVTDTTSNKISSGLYTFDVDTIPPDITGLEISIINGTLYLLYFNASEPVNATVEYGETTLYNSSYGEHHLFLLEPLEINTTYFFNITFADLAGNFNYSLNNNFTTAFFDLVSPAWSSNISYPESPAIYSPSQIYQFNVTWEDYELDKVWIEHNFSGSPQNITLEENESGVFFYTHPPIAAGSYFWRMHANDSSGNYNVTNTFSFVIEKAESLINLTFNRTEGDRTIVSGDSLIINSTIQAGEQALSLYMNGTQIGTGIAVIETIMFNDTGIYNFTSIYEESENYSFSYKTFFVNVTPYIGLEAVIKSPENHSIFTEAFTLNITTNKEASCEFTTDGIIFNNSLSGGYSHVALVSLADGIYNITVNCSATWETAVARAVNITVETSTPALNINYPASMQVLNGLSITLNYTLNESNIGKVWYTVNLDSSKNFIVPTDTSGEVNSELIMFLVPGKKTLHLFANDTSGRISARNVTFFLNSTLNATSWTTSLNNSLSQVSMVTLYNSSNEPAENISIEGEFSLALNFTNISVEIINFTGLNTSWDTYFNAMDYSEQFENEVISIGTDTLDYIYIANFSYFLNEDDYYGRVRLPRNRSSYTNIYFCNQGASGCQKVNTTCSGYSKQDIIPCYNNTPDSVFVYVPHFSSVFGDNDTIAPTINITLPGNNSIVNSSYQNSIAFSTNEEATCLVSINQGDFISASSSDNRYFVAFYNASSNSEHNLTVNCTDLNSNLADAVIYFTINDTTAPELSSATYSSTTTAITITFSTDEPANRTVYLTGKSPVSSSSFQLSHSATFSSLSSDTSYSYNITLCDIIGNCRNHSGTAWTDLPSNTGGDSGSTGGSASSTSTGIATSTNKANQIWTNPMRGDYTMNIPSTRIAFSQIIFTLLEDLAGNGMITVEKIDNLPSTIPVMHDKVFQYLRVDKAVFTDSSIRNVKIRFKVEKSWVRDNRIDPESIRLYRYTNAWAMLQTTRTSEDSSYYLYEAQSPGLSYFAISGEELSGEEAAIIETDDEKSLMDTTGEVTSITSVKDTNQEKKQGTSLLWLILLPFAIITIIVGGIFAILIIKKSNISVGSDKELKELRDYVEKCMAQGISFESIKNALIKVGWDDYIVDMVIHNVHLPDEDMEKLIRYIKNMRLQNKKDEQIKDNLIKVGWQEQVINLALEQTQKKK